MASGSGDGIDRQVLHVRGPYPQTTACPKQVVETRSGAYPGTRRDVVRWS